MTRNKKKQSIWNCVYLTATRRAQPRYMLLLYFSRKQEILVHPPFHATQRAHRHFLRSFTDDNKSKKKHISGNLYTYFFRWVLFGPAVCHLSGANPSISCATKQYFGRCN